MKFMISILLLTLGSLMMMSALFGKAKPQRVARDGNNRSAGSREAQQGGGF